MKIMGSDESAMWLISAKFIKKLHKNFMKT